MPTTRPAAVAGRFYPGAAAALARTVDALLGEALEAHARARTRGLAAAPPAAAAAPVPKLLVVPHAGYAYSGATAARAYATLGEPQIARLRRIVLLGPAHRVALRGLALPTVAAFATPLGRVPLDLTAREQLAGLPQVVLDDAAHALEHSIEVQLPFLQRRLRAFSLVPLAVGQASAAEVDEVVERLWGGSETLVVVSSDLSHELPYEQAQSRDTATVSRLLAFASDLDGEQACGAAALNGALPCAARHRLVPELIDLRNSGDTAGDRERVVGYAALAFGLPPTPATRGAKALPVAEDHPLGEAVLGAVRHAIAVELGLPAPPALADHAALQQPGACFVTLRDASGRLRGCIGRTDAVPVLADALQHAACAAAFRDPRFEPLRADEWPGLQLEVSLLSPTQPLVPSGPGLRQAAAALRPGVDGVSLHAQGRKATLLPQVWASVPDPAEFLAALVEKAGLGDRDIAATVWREHFRLETYGVQAFSGPALPERGHARPEGRD